MDIQNPLLLSLTFVPCATTSNCFVYIIVVFMSEITILSSHTCMYVCVSLCWHLCTLVCADQESMEKDRKIRELSSVHESDMQKIEDKLCSTRMELDTVKQESVSILVTSLNEIGVRSVSRDMKFCMNFFIKFYSFITNILIRVQFVEKQRGMGEYLKKNVITNYSTFTCTQKVCQ